MTDKELVFTLITPNELKDDIVDRLMNFDVISGFNLTAINGYSKKHSEYNIEEQVRGYRELTRFDILISASKTNKLKAHLSALAQRNELRYWQTAVIEGGHIL